MKYALDVTVNLPNDERHFVEVGSELIGIHIEEILERFPQTTSLVVIIVPIKQIMLIRLTHTNAETY